MAYQRGRLWLKATGNLTTVAETNKGLIFLVRRPQAEPPVASPSWSPVGKNHPTSHICVCSTLKGEEVGPVRKFPETLNGLGFLLSLWSRGHAQPEGGRGKGGWTWVGTTSLESLSPGESRDTGWAWRVGGNPPASGRCRSEPPVMAERASCPAKGSQKKLGQEGQEARCRGGSRTVSQREEPGSSRNHQQLCPARRAGRHPRGHLGGVGQRKTWTFGTWNLSAG